MENGGREALEDVVIQALGHRERRNILKIVRASERGASYTEIAAELGINTVEDQVHWTRYHKAGITDPDEPVQMYRFEVIRLT